MFIFETSFSLVLFKLVYFFEVKMLETRLLCISIYNFGMLVTYFIDLRPFFKLYIFKWKSVIQADSTKLAPPHNPSRKYHGELHCLVGFVTFPPVTGTL